MQLPCGHTAADLGLEHRDGTVDPDKFRQHVYHCPACGQFADALDAGVYGPALQIGFKALEDQRNAAEQRRKQAQELRAWPGKVRRLRRSLGLSQQALADRLGVTRVTVTRWETGRKKPQRLARKAVQQEIERLNKAILER